MHFKLPYNFIMCLFSLLISITFQPHIRRTVKILLVARVLLGSVLSLRTVTHASVAR